MFLANENWPRPSVLLLREKGYSVKSIQEDNPGITDLEVIDFALANNLVILTFDRDYGEIIFRYSQPRKPGVIYFRNKGSDPEFAGRLLAKMLASKEMNFENAFTVVEETNIRQRFY